jgi:hypothetical protein
VRSGRAAWNYRTETLRQPGGTTIQGVLDLTPTEAMQDRLIMTLIGASARRNCASSVAVLRYRRAS